MTFEKWWEEVGDNLFYENEKSVIETAWGLAWQAATLAERERAAKVAETHDADYWDDHAGQGIAAAIRKGEGV